VRSITFLALILSAGCERTDCPQPTPQPLMNGGFGEPCGRAENCASGLECRPTYETRGYDAPSFGSNACTLPCDAGCPFGSRCAALPGPPPFSTCLRECASDDDCMKGISSGVCDAGACYRTQCTQNEQCPSGYTCEVPAIVCCPRGTQCVFAGPVAGYCRRG